MSFRHAFHSLTFAAALWSFLALVATGQLHVPVIVAFLVLFCIAALRHRLGLYLSPLVWTLLSLGAFLMALYGWFHFDRLYSVTYFFFFLEINKLMTARRNRDYFQIYALTFFKMLAAAVSTQSVVFAPMLAVYIFLIIAAMMTFTIKRDAEQAFAPRRRGKGIRTAAPVRLVDHDVAALRRVAEGRYWDPRMTSWVATLTIVVIVSGTLIFWIVPRTARSSFIPGLGGQHNAPRTSGYAEEINFGGIGEIQSDSTIVMRAIPDSDYVATRPEFLRIRGTALDSFTGRQWTKSRSTARGEVSSYQSNSVTFSAESVEALRPSRPFRARLQLEPETSGYFFAIDRPARIDFPEAQQLEVDRDRVSLKSTRSRHSPISYEVRSFIAEEGPLPRFDMARGTREAIVLPNLRQGDPLEVIKVATEFFQQSRRRHDATLDRRSPHMGNANPAYLDLPDLPDMESVRRLATEWTVGFDNDIEIAEEVERRLREEFSYSLEAPFSNRDDHITQFLTQARAGHCEYFATAMALMLRAEGIPARVVNGYVTDEWSTTGRRYIVRQEHAHSWVEAQLNGSNHWTMFDPTPPGGIGSNRIGGSFLRVLSAWADNMKTIWYDRFIDYGIEDQRSGFIATLRALRQGHESTRGMMDSFAGWFTEAGDAAAGRGVLGLFFLIGGGLVLVVVVTVALRSQIRRKARAAEMLASGFDPEKVREFLNLLEELERMYPRRRGQTPRAYAAVLAREHSGRLDDLPALADAYYRVRFDGAEWTSELSQRVQRLRLSLADNASGRDNLASAAGK